MELAPQVDSILQKIKYYLIIHFGKTLKEASLEEFYLAFCFALREKIMLNWTTCLHTFDQKKARTLYYLSMEYLPGRLLGNNITNIGALDVIKLVLEKTGRNFSELIECEPDPGLGNGGLGRLASCFLDSLATQEYPAWGYGLRYQYGIFEQEIWNGIQVERPDCWLINENPWEFRRDTDAANVLFRGKMVNATNSHGDEIFQLEDYEEVRALPYDTPIIGYPKNGEFPVATLRLWTTKESPRNFELQRYNAGHLDQAGENTSLTDVLYPNDNHETGKRLRLKQEFLLVSASIQDIIKRHIRVYENLDQFADKVRIQINDTHPALAIAELVRRLTTNHDLPFEKAWEITQTCCSYTNHTILREALEEWNEQRLFYLLPRQYNIIQKLNLRFCNQVRQKFQGSEEHVRRMSFIEEGQVKMAHLCLFGCHKTNGVAKLHTEILKTQVFKDFFELYPDRFESITNGVTQRRWLVHANPELHDLITAKIGSGWITNFTEIAKFKEFASQEEVKKAFWEIKKKNKEKLIYFLTTQNPIRDFKGKVWLHSTPLTADSLFDVQIKRIHEYKRPLLNILHLIMLYFELKEKRRENPVPRTVIIGGKAAPGYENAKRIIQLIYAISDKIKKDPEVSQYLQLAFIENYNVSKAQIIIPAADLSEQISLAGMEASGTGNMKLAMNGALTLGTMDGANIEMREEIGEQWWPFGFGIKAEEAAELKLKGNYNPWDIYSQDEPIRRAVESLKDGTFSRNEAEGQSFSHLYQSLLEGNFMDPPDRYFVLKDLRAYYETQKKVEELYRDPSRWAEFALHNIAGMGAFSTDTSIKNYAEKIWDLAPCPYDPTLLHKLKESFS